MIQVIVIYATLLLAPVLAEPPVDLTYLPPNSRGAILSHNNAPQMNGFDGSNPFRTANSPSHHHLPSINLKVVSVGTKSRSDSGGQRSSELSNVYGAPFEQSSRNFNSHGATAEVASRSGDSISSPPLSSAYGVPNTAPRQSFSRSRSGSSSFSAPSASYGAPNAVSGQSFSRSRFGPPSFSPPSASYGVPSTSSRASTTLSAPARPDIRLSNVYGAPSRSANSSSAASSRSQLSAKYGSPAKSSFGSRAHSSYSPSGNDIVPKYTAAIPFNSALDNTFAVNAAPSNNGYSQQLPTGNDFLGYGKLIATEDPLSEPANYEYNYEVQDGAESGAEFGHKEFRENESAKGVYHVLLPDGRMQIVEYEADETGYRPRIRYEETGYPEARSGQNGYYY